MAKRNADKDLPGSEVTVFVAKTDIQMGDPIGPGMVREEPWPKSKVPANAITNMDDLVSRRSRARIFAGSPILDNQLLRKGATDIGAGGLIPKGFRVVAVKVDPSIGSSSIIRPSDRVDVLVHLKADSARGMKDSTTKMVVQNVKVFAVNDVYDVNSTTNEKSIAAKTISLLVLPAQARDVTQASEAGTIRLVMRGIDDNEVVASFDKTPNGASGLFDLLKKFAAAKAPETTPPTAALPAVPAVPIVPESKQFSMRVITGSQMNDTVLQAKPGADESDPLSWRTVGANEMAAGPNIPPSFLPPAAKLTPPATINPKAEPAKAEPPKPAIPGSDANKGKPEPEKTASDAQKTDTTKEK
jgi:pilus assembly protein CpaB